MNTERRRVMTLHTIGGIVILYHRHRCPICGRHWNCSDRNCLMVDYQECPSEHEERIELIA